MPLLKKKSFEKASPPANLRDDEEVFYCAITDEIFRDYEEFSERMFLCNSMVWTCSMTGKANLTYMEAVESEENAVRCLKEFPDELKTPILYLATKTKRTTFREMADDVFNYVTDRFFIGENVETCFAGNKWKESHILQVIAPTEEQIKNAPKNGSTGGKYFHPPASLYKYEIEHLDAQDADISEIMIADRNQIRRKEFNRDKSKLFLKQNVEQSESGHFVIKQSVIDSFGLNKVTFGKIFDGPLPNFEVSIPKKKEKANGQKKALVNGHQKKGATVNGQKKSRQDTLHKFLTKGGQLPADDGSIGSENKINLLEQMKKKEEQFKLMQQQKKEAQMAMKQKLKEQNLLLAGHLKDWYKPKEDLELSDQKKLPIPNPVKLKVPDKHVGDMFMVLEFVDSFSKFLCTKTFFPSGLTIELMERALTENEVAGPFMDLVQMLLTAVFEAQEEEAKEVKFQLERVSKTESEKNNVQEAIRLATLAYRWSRKHQGMHLNQLPLCPLTTTEILRLHLLSSGARVGVYVTSWRYQQRGGYTNEDDPGLYLRVHHPHIIKMLTFRSVIDLSIEDKLRVLTCLVDQLMTYANVRDVIEERVDKQQQAKRDAKLVMIAEKKREQEYAAARWKMKRVEKGNPNLQHELSKLEEDTENKKMANMREFKKIFRSSKPLLMGLDRAYRRYLLLESVPGVFVNFEEPFPGECLSDVVKQNPELVNAGRDETLAYLRKALEETNSSDKENSPSSKSPKTVNGARTSFVMQQDKDTCRDLLMCSADPTNCEVHTLESRTQSMWSFFHNEEAINELINSLNKRGIRESELQQNLDNHLPAIENILSKMQVEQLNPDFVIKMEEKEERTKRTNTRSNPGRYNDANLGFPQDTDPLIVQHNLLIDNILEIEERIYNGDLGKLLIDDRDKWRNDLQTKNYSAFDRTLIKRERPNSKDKENNRCESPDGFELKSLCQDPGSSSEENSGDSTNGDVTEAITCLAIALVQVARSVYPKYLKKPLGREYTNQHYKLITERLELWEKSLLDSTSFSQIFLHYFTLDSCVMWSRSILLAKCRICRKAQDSENMLLCDTCNLGTHLYCLRPPLHSIPSGDWHCAKCFKEKKKEEESMMVVNPPPTLRKRRIFRDDDEDENEEGNSSSESDEENDEEEADEEESEEGEAAAEEEEEEDSEDEESNSSVKVELCKTCGSGGEMVCCEECSSNYHIECVEPPLRRAPRGPWCCTKCKKSENLKRKHNDSGDEVISKRPSRREDARNDLPLHNSALQDLLSEIMKDTNAWPFLRPVQKNEVPDYYDVITKPMDFGTIKYKLNMGGYSEDAQFMSDAVLVFQNCNTYNHTDDDVFKCGVELLKHFQKKCRELGLKLPDEMDYDEDENMRSRKKRRIK